MKNKRTDNKEILLFFVLLFALTFAFYWPAFRVFFSLDDLQFLSRAAGLSAPAAGLRRLVSTRLFFAASWKLFGPHPWPYHVVVLSLHTVNACILFLLARRLHLKKSSAFVASLLFVTTYVAFLPLHWISGIQEVSAAFFALVSAYFFLGKTTSSLILSLLSGCLAMLCKEMTFLLLPAYAAVLPAPPKRRWILGSAGLALGITFLAVSGSLAPRPPGDPYESAFGANILWNLLTYSAWLVRFWDYFPERLAQPDAALAGWGLILPALLGLAAWRMPKARGAIARAALLFMLTVMPVLPLVRHSYLYYLYLPLIPFWLLGGAYLGTVSRRYIPAVIIALFMLHSGLNGVRHRTAERGKGMLEDPILRYAAVAEAAVTSFRAEGGIGPGDYLILTHMSQKPVDLTKGLKDLDRRQRVRFALVERALLGGEALRLFFPAIQRVHFVEDTESGSVPGWQQMHLYVTYQMGLMKRLGYGEEGRLTYAQKQFENGFYDQAKREFTVLLGLHPDDPRLLHALGQIARMQGDSLGLQTMIERLEEVASREDPGGTAHQLLNELRQSQ
jgi:hypothetical protein